MYKSGMIGEITMCRMYDKQLYYYGNDIPKPDHKRNCFEEMALNSKRDVGIDKVIRKIWRRLIKHVFMAIYRKEVNN